MSKTHAQILSELKVMISDFSGVHQKNINEESMLETDLRIYGDDTIDLLIIYSEQYNIDMSAFKGEEYIASEGDTLLPAIKKFFNGEKQVSRKDIKVADLVNGVITGVFNPSTLND
ncbi:DUF1493 family protein [Mucilaginibacter limnophilus]|uniref:DUF1493 family protein n=1 Tax=Mucilaginibacter limnophilus TaxID=1932778 RepID=A0A437MSE7_9SPHI|nr:DUF1493 family protein [Mucilaginibacter limnophilus]RVU00584.1 DUF1493 family protein [Mucilaginibacter limnophilus]